MTDILKALPLTRFRDIPLPVVSRDVSFSHDNVPHKFAYRNGVLVETTGAQGWTFRYTLSMSEGIAVGPYANLFTRGLQELVLLMRDKEPGELVDPYYGTFRVAPASFSDTLTAEFRNGAEVSVEFVEAPELGDVEDALRDTESLAGLVDNAGKLDEEISRVDWQQEVPPEPTQDPLRAVAGVGQQIEASGNRTLAAVENFIDSAETVEETAQRLEDPAKTFSIQRRARRSQELGHTVKRRLDSPGRNVRTVTTRYTQTISELAASHGMTVLDLLKLNPSLAGLPTVSPGEVIRVIRAATS